MAFINAEAQREYEDIMTHGNTTQKLVCTLGWTDVVLASSRHSLLGLTRGAVFARGPVFFAQYALRSSSFRLTSGKAVAGVNTANGNIEVLACDVSASPWWHGNSPEIRAGSRMT